MKIKATMEMDYYELMPRLADHYKEEKSCALEYIYAHSDKDGNYDEMLTDTIITAVKFDDFRLTFEKYINEEYKINNHNIKHLVAFGLTLEYFGIKNIEISY